MAKFTNTSDNPVTLTSIKIKQNGSRGVRLDLSAEKCTKPEDFKLIDSNIATATVRRQKKDTYIFNISIKSQNLTGTTKLIVKHKGETVAELAIEVLGKELKLPNEATPAGLLARLFIAESVRALMQKISKPV